jgi:hypothetical protein
MTEQPDAIKFDADFDARARAYIVADDKAFADWLATGDIDALIDRALTSAKAEHKANVDMVEEANPRSTIAMIDLGQQRSRLLAQALARRRLGQIDMSTYSWDLTLPDIIKRGEFNSYAQARATVEAFALALSVPGFELRMLRQ